MNVYHSHLLINVGDNPDRPDWSIGRRWLRNLYRVHQRLCWAFPSTPSPSDAKLRAALYCEAVAGPVSLQQDLNGNKDEHGPEEDTGPIHQPRSENANFLFRIDHPVDYSGGLRRPVIIVQSANNTPPDWDRAFGLNPGQTGDRGRPVGNADYLLSGPPQTQRIRIEVDGDELVLDRPEYRGHNLQTHRFRAGDSVRFRLRANPTEKRAGKRKRLDPRPEHILAAHGEWLQRKLGQAASGSVVVDNLVPGWAYAWRGKYEPQADQRMQLWSVLFEGKFTVGDPATLRDILLCGIGSAKAFGFGLLSVAPVR